MAHTERFAVGDRPRLEVLIPSGSVQVRTGGGGTIEVSVDGGDDVEVASAGNTVTVRRESRFGLRTRSVRVVAAVPPGTDVEVGTASAEVRLEGLLGTCRVRTASGRFEADRVASLELTSASGDVRVREVDGDVEARTVSGDLVLGAVGGRMVTTCVSGDVRVDLVRGDLRAGTTSGDVRVERCDGNDVTVKSVSGDVVLGLPTGIRVEADLSTLSGRATLPLRDDSLPPPGIVRRPVRLTVRTVSGDITIRRAG